MSNPRTDTRPAHPSNTPAANLLDLFHYHAPRGGQPERYKAVNDAARELARVIVESCPGCADTSTAIRAAREARMWANSAIALEPRE